MVPGGHTRRGAMAGSQDLDCQARGQREASGALGIEMAEAV